MPQIVIDFDKLADIGLKGVRRAAVFMGLGLNAAHDSDFKNYRLSSVQNIPGPTHMELIPSNVNDETLSHFKKEFGTWVIANGLREVIERFAVFLDGVHHACQWIAVNKRKLQPAEAEELDQKFRFKGLEGKLHGLEARFGIRSKYPEYIVSINQARNCLTHRLGKVGVEDCDGDQRLEVKWIGMDFQIKFESGRVVPLREVIGEVLPESGTPQIKIVERCKAFSRGTFVRFEMWELAEICNFILSSITAVTASAIEYAKSVGIELVTQPPETHQADNPNSSES